MKQTILHYPNTAGLSLLDHCMSIAQGKKRPNKNKNNKKMNSSKFEMSYTAQVSGYSSCPEDKKTLLYETIKLTLIQRDHLPSN